MWIEDARRKPEGGSPTPAPPGAESTPSGPSCEDFMAPPDVNVIACLSEVMFQSTIEA